MSNKDLLLRPTSFKPGCWYYEEPRGLAIYNNQGEVGVIPWSKLRKSLERKDKEAQ